MDNWTDLKETWQTAYTDVLPGYDAIIKDAKKFRDKKLYKKARLIVAGLVLTIMMIATVFVYKSHMATTRLGECCLIIAGGILVATNANSIGRFYRFKDFNNNDFIKFLEKTRSNQICYYKKTQVTALAFCSAGLLLYPFEAVYKQTYFFIATYIILGLYLLILWFVVRPRALRRQTKKLNTQIEKLQQLLQQISKEI